jgi:hypothetical protein
MAGRFRILLLAMGHARMFLLRDDKLAGGGVAFAVDDLRDVAAGRKCAQVYLLVATREGVLSR